MRDGSFTSIIYEMQGNTLTVPEREGVVVGVPQRVAKKLYYGPVTSVDYTLDATESNKMKTHIGDKLVASTDLRLYIRTAGESNSEAIEMNTINHFSTKPAVSISNYNSDGLDAVTMLATDFLKQIGKNYGGANLTFTMAVTSAVVTVGGSNATAFMLLLEAGQCFYHPTDDSGSGVYYEILSVDTANSQFTLVEDAVLALAAVATTPKVYYDYLGASMNTVKARRPVVLYDIIVQRPIVSGLYTITTVNDLIDLFDAESLEDPDSNLAFGAFLHLAANGGLYQMRLYAIPVDGSTATATILETSATWVTAQQKMAAIKTAYYIAPLTDNETTLGLFKTWAVGMSSTENKKEKIVFISEKIVNSGNGVDYETSFASANALTATAAAATGANTVITLGGAQTILADAQIGMKFSATYDGQVVESNVIAVNDDSDNFTVDVDYGSTYDDLSTPKLYWPQDSLFMDSGYDAQSDVDVAINVPNGYATQRVVLCAPYYATMGTTNLVGYYVASIIAGYISAREVGEGTTGATPPSVTWLPTINYFTITQLEALKNAGWFLLNQEMEGAPVTIYHQNTTDQVTIEKKELSLVIALDTLAQTVREMQKPYIARGLANRISSNPSSQQNVRYIKKLNGGLSQIKYSFITQKEIFGDFKVIGISVNTHNSDQIDTHIEVTHLYPVNRINNFIHVV